MALEAADDEAVLLAFFGASFDVSLGLWVTAEPGEGGFAGDDDVIVEHSFGYEFAGPVAQLIPLGASPLLRWSSRVAPDRRDDRRRTYPLPRPNQCQRLPSCEPGRGAPLIVACYLDTSALAKLVVAEPETAALCA
ncbi:MAG: hypothetical protein M3O32_11995 [Actinomycetota bacterium]|nr:hypothetical protein [Actinomycetota bacterium]